MAAPFDMAEYARQLGVSIAYAAEWHAQCTETGYFAVSFLIPFVYNKERGILFLQTTAQSTRMMNENSVRYFQGDFSGDPHWIHYAVYWYPGLVSFQFNLYNSPYIHFGMLGPLLTQWLGTVWHVGCMLENGSVYQSLRRILVTYFKALHWTEVCSGYSLYHFRGLDVYLRVVSNLDQSPKRDAWWVCNLDGPPERRRVVSPEAWFSPGGYEGA